MKKFKFGDEARAELNEALDYYRGIRADLVDGLLSEINSAIRRVCEFPK